MTGVQTCALPIYDLIICVGVLAYVHNAHSFAEKVLSLSTPGGDVILECTDSDHPISILGRAFGAVRGLISRPRVPLVLHTSREVIDIFSRLGFSLRNVFRYSLPPPGVRRVLSQTFQYKSVRTLYGCPKRNRMPWLGSECIYHFRRDV